MLHNAYFARSHVRSPKLSYFAKLLRARAQIFGGLGSGSIIALSSPYDDSPEAALETLRGFLDRVEPLDRLLFRAAS